MKRAPEPALGHRLGFALLVSFGLTMASFMLSTWIADHQGRGISGAAELITGNAVPSIDHLANLRTGVRRLEVTLDDYTDRVADGGVDANGPRQIAAGQRQIADEWRAYNALPTFHGEQALWPAVNATLAQVNGSIDDIYAQLNRHHGTSAEAILDKQAKPGIDRLDDQLRGILELNARNAASLGREIYSLRATSHHWALLLDVLSAIFALIAALAAIRIVRRYASLMEHRVSDLEQFAGRVAHDIRSPLTSVGLALELAQRDTPADSRSHATLARGTRTLQRVGQLVDGLLMFARAGAGPLEKSQANVQVVVRDVIDDMLPAAREKEIDLRVAKIEPRWVACHPGVLASLISNVVGNAIKYMGDAPIRQVTLSVRRIGGQVRFEVTDTGPGVPSDLQPRVFDPFVRSAGATTPGLGLGLATVRRLAEAHGGVVGLESAGGAGSVFWFELPEAASPARA